MEEQNNIYFFFLIYSSEAEGGEEERDQSIASRTRYHLARRSTTTTALHTESLPSQQNLQTPITNTDPTDPLPTPQPTNDHSLTGLQDRKRAPPKHSRRWLENHTGVVSSMSEASDEEVAYGSFDIVANTNTDSDHTWSTSQGMIVETK